MTTTITLSERERLALIESAILMYVSVQKLSQSEKCPPLVRALCLDQLEHIKASLVKLGLSDRAGVEQMLVDVPNMNMLGNIRLN